MYIHGLYWTILFKNTGDSKAAASHSVLGALPSKESA